MEGFGVEETIEIFRVKDGLAADVPEAEAAPPAAGEQAAEKTIGSRTAA
ncbi:MAG: hypothetical protein JW929_15240 [Anaerolineales bacterium]|nr:hypothetical protein [Anaerolineales bacterium]